MKNIYFNDEWKARKVFEIFHKKQNSTFAFKNNSNYSKFLRASKNKTNTEVVIKITSSSKNLNLLKAHINYITRQGDIELVDSDYNLYSNKDEIKNACNNFNSIYKIPTQNEIINFRQKEKRETYNIVFSMKEHSLAPVNKIRIAAINTIKKKYPDNYFVIAMHNDTDNPHCHLCLKAVNKNGKRINIKKADLNELRKNFAIELRKLNIEATATIKRKINIETGRELEENIYIKNEIYSKTKKHKAHHYRVIDFGEANYNFDKEKPISYFVKYRTNKGKDVIIWSNNLKDVVENNNIKKDEYCRFAIVDEEPVVVKEEKKYKKDGKEYIQIIDKEVYRKIWDVSIENRAEKKLNPLKEFTPNTSTITDEYEYHKAHHYEILSFGKANYKFNINNKESFYVKYKTKNNEEYEIWSKELENVIEKNNITIGEYCRFAVVEQKPYEFIIHDRQNNLKFMKKEYKNIWDVSIENRAKKKLNPLKEFMSPEYKIIRDENYYKYKENMNKVKNSGQKSILKEKDIIYDYDKNINLNNEIKKRQQQHRCYKGATMKLEL